jgi:hypothetical protein
MAEIRVWTTVEITNHLGKVLVAITKESEAIPQDNPRFWATYTRGACQANEHALNTMLTAEYGDVPPAGTSDLPFAT